MNFKGSLLYRQDSTLGDNKNSRQRNENKDDDSEVEDQDKGREWTPKYVQIDGDDNVGLTIIT